MISEERISCTSKSSGYTLREKSKSLSGIQQIADILLVVFSFVAAYHCKQNFIIHSISGLATEPNYYLILLTAVLTAAFFFRAAGFYQPYRSQSFAELAMRTLKAVGGIFACTVIVLYLFHERYVSRLLLLLFSIILFGTLLLTHSLVRAVLRHYRNRNYNVRNVLIVGTGGRAKRMIQAISEQETVCYRIIGCLEPFREQVSGAEFVADGVKVLSTVNKLPVLLLEEIVDEVIFAADLGNIPAINEYIRFAEHLGINIHIVPDFQLEKIMYQPETAAVFMERFAGLPTIAISTVPQQEGELFVKGIMDYVGAFCALLLSLPLFAVIVLIIKATSSGPAFFVQQRCGLYGRTFSMIKFRTMVANAEALRKDLQDKNEVDGPVFKISDDPRITPIGKFLRKTSLDELPQLINVLAGHMSLVGPRPPLPSEVAQYAPWQRRRLSMKPGITCIWQVSGRNGVGFDRWMKMDLEYIDNWSLLLDIKILCKTAREVVLCRGK